MNGPVKANAGTVDKNIGADQHCFKCDETGHLSRDCPNRHKLHCTHCNKKGHIKKNCWDIHGVPEGMKKKVKDEDEKKEEEEETKQKEEEVKHKALTAQLQEESDGSMCVLQEFMSNPK